MITSNKEPRLLHMDGFNVAGLSVKTANRDEFNPSTAKLSHLWQRFFTEGLTDSIPHRLCDSPLFGVYSDYESDADGLYTVTAGVKSSRSSNTLAFSTVRVLSGHYLVFENKGVMPQAVIETWKRVWDYFASYPIAIRCFKTDFEMYQGGGDVAIYIGVETGSIE